MELSNPFIASPPKDDFEEAIVGIYAVLCAPSRKIFARRRALAELPLDRWMDDGGRV